MTDRPTDAKCEAAKTSDGSPCQNPAGFKTTHLGFGRCHLHSGATPNGVKAAEKEKAAWLERLAAEIDPSLNTVARLRDDDAVEPRTRLAAAKDFLDRAGVRSENGAEGDGVEIIIRWPDRA